MIAASGVAINAPANPKAEPIASKRNNVETGCMFIVEERSRGITKLPTISFNARKKTITHITAFGSTDNATKTGGMDMK